MWTPVSTESWTLNVSNNLLMTSVPSQERHTTVWLTIQYGCKSLVSIVMWFRFWISVLASPWCLRHSEPSPLSALTLSVSTSVMWIILPASSRSHQEKKQRGEDLLPVKWRDGLTAEINSEALSACLLAWVLSMSTVGRKREWKELVFWKCVQFLC